MFGARFNAGDFLVAVHWYERLAESGDGERREFVRGKQMIDVINSTELREAGVKRTSIGAFPFPSSEESDGP